MKERDRQIIIKMIIEDKLKDILRAAKKRQQYNANDYISQLYGIIYYMAIVGDITIDTRERINKLVVIIKRKYIV